MSMFGQSLGLIETVGLAAAIEAADAAIKSANVELLGYESAKGNGMHTVKLVGDVGAVNAAVAAGVAAASRIGKVYAYKVIARTAEGLESVIANGENVAIKTQEVEQVHEEQKAQAPETAEVVAEEVISPLAENVSPEVAEEKSVVTVTTSPKAEQATEINVTKPVTPTTNKTTTTSNRTKARTNRQSASN
ncbi:BMC domain-containing protein [Vibrio sp. FJH11]